MSIEYEVRSDDRYSRHTPLAAVRDYLITAFSVRPESPDFLIYDRDHCRVEISLAAAEGGASDLEYIASIPAGAGLKSADRAASIGQSLARHLGWRLFDPQQNDYIDFSPAESGPPLRDAISQLLREVRQESAGLFLRRIWRRCRKQSLSSIGLMLLAGVFGAIVAGWLFGFRPELRPGLSLGLIAAVVGLGVAGDILLDVVGEVHTEATRRKGAAGVR